MCTQHTSTMSPVNEIQDYDYYHQIKGNYQIWSFRDELCRIESQKAVKCVQLTVKACTCEMLILMCTQHTSTMSPVNVIQNYDYYHQAKGNY